MKYFITGILLAVLSLSLSAQSNEIIDTVLSQKNLSCGNGAYLALSGAGLIDQSLSPEEALDSLKDLGWISESRQSGAPMTLGEYSTAVMQGFALKGGLMYTLTKWPRYASRELGFKGYISRDAGAYRTLSGSEAVSILGMVIRREKG